MSVTSVYAHYGGAAGPCDHGGEVIGARNCSLAVPFGTRERIINIGFVSARIRLFNLIHRGVIADICALPEGLAGLPPPTGWTAPAAPRLVRVRLHEPQSGAGLVMFPLSWAEYAGGGTLVPVLEAALTVRAIGAGQTGLRLHGTARLSHHHRPAAPAGPAAPLPQPLPAPLPVPVSPLAGGAALAGVAGSWLSRLEDGIVRAGNLPDIGSQPCRSPSAKDVA